MLIEAHRNNKATSFIKKQNINNGVKGRNQEEE
jgi:hypothetical protein